MADITYHKADQNDLQTLINLRIEFLTEVQHECLFGESSTESIKILKKDLADYFVKSLNDTCIFYLAKDANDDIGVGGLVIREHPGSLKNPSGKFGYIMNMYTVPSYRKRGICTDILNLLITDASKLGISYFELHASKEGEPVYQKNGFELTDQPNYKRHVETF